MCPFGSYIISSSTKLVVSNVDIGSLIISSSEIFLSSTTTSDLEVDQSTVNFIDGSLIYINGNLYTGSSVLNLDHTNIIIEGNAYLLNTTLKLSSNSSFSIGGCMNINNITIDLDVDATAVIAEQNLTLFTFNSDNCKSSPTFNVITFVNSDCVRATAVPNVHKNSVVVTLREEQICTQVEESTMPYWARITLYTLSALIGAIIIALLVVLIVPSMRHQLFPFRDQVPDYTL
jgi:hypothetical protein